MHCRNAGSYAFQRAVAFEHINDSMEFFGMSIAKSNRTDFYTEEGIIADWHEMQQFMYNFTKVSNCVN